MEIFALLEKPSRREVDVDVRYRGYEIPDEFVVGFGLDYDERFRNLDSIAVLKPPQNRIPEKKPATSSVSSEYFTLGRRKAPQQRRNAP
mgnify:CR=1 FL=1